MASLEERGACSVTFCVIDYWLHPTLQGSAGKAASRALGELHVPVSPAEDTRTRRAVWSCPRYASEPLKAKNKCFALGFDFTLSLAFETTQIVIH